MEKKKIFGERIPQPKTIPRCSLSNIQRSICTVVKECLNTNIPPYTSLEDFVFRQLQSPVQYIEVAITTLPFTRSLIVAVEHQILQSSDSEIARIWESTEAIDQAEA